MSIQKQETDACCNGVCTPERAAAVAKRTYRPNVEVREMADAFLFTTDLPGTEPGGISVTFENGRLSLAGSVPPRQSDATRYLLREYGVGDFSRSFEIHERIDPAGICAELHSGVLTITVPKAVDAKPRKIEVQVGERNLN